VSLLLCTGWFQ